MEQRSGIKLSGRTRGRKGLAQVVTTMILLVFSILLSGTVVYYSVNMVQVRLQTEEVRLVKEKIWVNSTGAVAALKIQNLGGRDILIDKLQIRGVNEPWTDVWYYRVPQGTAVNGDLNVTSYANLDGTPTIDGRSYVQATDDLDLASGRDLIIYIKGPDNVQLDDIGTTVSISLHTANNQYITESNVRSAN
jgi:hypothetical protein